MNNGVLIQGISLALAVALNIGYVSYATGALHAQVSYLSQQMVDLKTNVNTLEQRIYDLVVASQKKTN